MAQASFTGLLTGSSTPFLASGDVVAFVDVSDTTQSPSGSLVKATLTQFFAQVPVPIAVKSASATAFTVGLNGATNPALAIDASTALQVAGLKVTGAVAGGTVAVVVTDSGSDANLAVNAKGLGTIGIGSVSTGQVTITPATRITGKLGVGIAPLTNTFMVVAGSVTAATAAARMLTVGGTLVAAANNDIIIGTNIAPAYTPGAFTGLAIRGISVAGVNTTGFTSPGDPIGIDVQAVDGTGATNAYGIKITLPVNATNNYLIGASSIGVFNVKADGTMVLGAGLAVSGATAPSNGIQFGTNAPGTLANGQIWYDGTDFKVRTGGATKTITIT